MSPAFVDKEGPHFLEFAYLSRELVSEIHLLCLLLADETVPDSEASSTYTFALRRLGRVLCKYQRRGNVASLILVRDADASRNCRGDPPDKAPFAPSRGEAGFEAEAGLMLTRG
ncbi:MAG: hypothetical protein IPP88_00280 [Betaproteobacteria bacterium]|nr:hypothetical protein [Betaproteobacteria bacterium]